MGRLEEITAAQGELDDYATGLVAERKGCPHADLVSDLVQATYDEDRLSVDELVAMIEAILLAGTDTTRNQLGSLLAVLAGQPDQYQAVRNDRSLVPAVVEESLRYIGAVRTTACCERRPSCRRNVLPSGNHSATGSARCRFRSTR